MERWEEEIRERELREKRRRAPGWLDSEERILEPERGTTREVRGSLMDAPSGEGEGDAERKRGEDLGDAMDRAFGRGLAE